MTETFAGPGDDWVFAGADEDTVFGDDGDDWIEGGLGPFNLLQGDNGAPFQDDPNEPGHDVLIGYGGEQDYDGEGGDDVMFIGPGIQRARACSASTGRPTRRPAAADSDMDFTVLLPPVETNRDRFDLVEALSGWNLNDTLRGDDRWRRPGKGRGHELTAAGIARIDGLAALLGGATSFTGGNIIMGGAGSDLIEGRGGNDVIDGDRWLDAELRSGRRVPRPVHGLRSAVAAGPINPGSISIYRSINTPTAAEISASKPTWRCSPMSWPTTTSP